MNTFSVISEKEVGSTGVSRRDMLQKVAVGSVLFAVGSILPGCGGTSSDSIANASVSDFDVLNFALNLEYLEAEFYAYATTGSGIDALGIGTGGTGASGPTTGGVKTTFTDSVTQAVANEIASDERDHVTFLRTALGSKRIGKPAINLAALGDFSTQSAFLALARAFEDVGVSAYGGAARLINSRDLVEAAARILAVEALHTGNIRLLIAQQAVATTAVDAKDVVPPPTGTQYFSTTTNSLSVIRSTREVLNIVYAGTGGSGGFFPNGFNGAIRV